jgi:hypothetical protein
MTNEKTTRELVYETNRDVKWICRTRCSIRSGAGAPLGTTADTAGVRAPWVRVAT